MPSVVPVVNEPEWDRAECERHCAAARRPCMSPSSPPKRLEHVGGIRRNPDFGRLRRLRQSAPPTRPSCRCGCSHGGHLKIEKGLFETFDKALMTRSTAPLMRCITDKLACLSQAHPNVSGLALSTNIRLD
jgi:hypothetical protein